MTRLILAFLAGFAIAWLIDGRHVQRSRRTAWHEPEDGTIPWREMDIVTYA
jgi:hypothetical protein